MYEQELRKKYSKIYPEIAEVILDEENCFGDIIKAHLETTKKPNFDLIDDSEVAYQIATHFPKYRDQLIDKVAESQWAFHWARYIGNRDVMIDRVTESRDAYRWAITIGDKDIMIDRVTESRYAYLWAIAIGNIDVMIDRVTESHYAYRWAESIGDVEIMCERMDEKFRDHFKTYYPEKLPEHLQD